MTSDKVESATTVALAYALGKRRVSLSQLTAMEFDEFLSMVLRDVDLRELRGFKSLNDLLSRNPGSFVLGQRQNPLETASLSPCAIFSGIPHGDGPFALTSQVISVSRGVIDQVVTYRRHESDEETTVRHIASDWKGGAYVRRAEEKILVIRRPNNHTSAENNLFEVWYDLEKVPHEDRMVIGQIKFSPVPLLKFREHFGDKYPCIAQYMIWELAVLSRITLESLQSQATHYLGQVASLERFAGAVTE